MSVLSSSVTQHEPDDQPSRKSHAQKEILSTRNWFDCWSRRAVLTMLKQLKHGQILVHEGNRCQVVGDPQAGQTVDIRVLDWKFYREVALGSSLGAGDAYVKGYWQSDDLLALLRMLSRNLTQRKDLKTLGLPMRTLNRQMTRRWNRNSRVGSRRNISRHYDLSNELFATFLDPTMTYSCGIFRSKDTSLEAASLEKYERICQKLNLQSGDSVVEIGCGWGGFAEYAASTYGCHVTGVTISSEQLDYARQRIARASLQDRVELRLCDYRDLIGSFDKLVSIEMIEAVGHEYLPTFFSKCCSLLKPDGQMLLQAITIPDDRYNFYRRSVDFIQKYIFPGGCLPCLGVMSSSISRVTDLRVTHFEDFAADYAKTLLAWRERFIGSTAELDRLGFDETFRRTWDYYFCYCAAGFLERQIGVAHLLLKRPEAE